MKGMSGDGYTGVTGLGGRRHGPHCPSSSNQSLFECKMYNIINLSSIYAFVKKIKRQAGVLSSRTLPLSFIFRNNFTCSTYDQ